MELLDLKISEAELKKFFLKLLEEGEIVTRETLAKYYLDEKDISVDRKDIKGHKTRESYFFAVNGNNRRYFSRVMKGVADNLANNGIDIAYKQSANKKTKFYKWPDNVPIEKLDSVVPEKKQEDMIVDILQAFDNLIPESMITKKIRERIELNSERYISFDNNQNLRNLKLLPTIIVAVKEKKVVKFCYKKSSISNIEEVILHPHHIKEFNNRWFVFGYKNGDSNQVSSYPIDRFVSETIDYVNDVSFTENTIDYGTYFDDIVGVTHFKDTEVEHLIVKTRNAYIHELIATKPLHESQIEKRAFDPSLNYGEFSLDVKYNPEIIGRLFMYESNIQVITEKGSKIYKTIRYHISQMAKIYNLRLKEK